MFVLLIVFGVVALLAPALTRRLGRRAFPLLAIVPAAAFVHALVVAPRALGTGIAVSVPWIPQLDAQLAVRMDALAFVLVLVVTGVGALVLLYCARYFHDGEEGLGRFAGVLLAFAGAMYGLVIADDVYLLFVMWEATTVFSYLLIGHSTQQRASRGAALQALMVTTLGGLVMLVGLVLLAVQADDSRLSAIVAAVPDGPLTTVAIVLVLVGAVSKSAIFPFHFWLPSTMAAPTPVSAYLHAAAMVKAGVYLVARLAPGFAAVPGWRETLVVLGIGTMLLGGYRALRQHDLKLLLAFGTVSQLGFLILVAGFGTEAVALGAIALLVAHACFKSTLFLTVGVIDHWTGTRDLRRLSGVGRANPVLAIVAVVAVASMAGLPPTLGFVAKEAVFTGLLDDAEASGNAWSWIALVGVVAGSVLTVAYSARFVWGAFARKPGVETVERERQGGFLLAPVVLGAAGLVLGLAVPLLGAAIEPYSGSVPSASVAGVEVEAAHLALWHGLEPALLLSLITLVGGLALFAGRVPVERLQRRAAFLPAATEVYRVTLRGFDRFAAESTALLQRGSLPYYLTVILAVFVGGIWVNLLVGGPWDISVRAWDTPVQLPVVVIIGVAAVAVILARTRFAAAVLVGITGYGMVVLFTLQGAPDLALTQAVVETVTLVAFVLVLRRLPPRIGAANPSRRRIVRAVFAAVVGTTVAVLAVVAAGARIATPDWLALPQLAYDLGHGRNVVNVALVDLRGWDTLGELGVVIAAATGIASLTFIRSRADALPRLNRREARDAGSIDGRRGWLPTDEALVSDRSALLDVVVRLLFHALIVLSVFLLFTGHNAPGGGFAGGLVAGIALAARYLAGGAAELGAAAPVRAGRLLAAGMTTAAATALVPLFFGVDALTSTFFEAEVPVLGHIEFVTSTFFDIGVYLVVVGLALDVLRSLGAEIDRQGESGPGDGQGDTGQAQREADRLAEVPQRAEQRA